MSSLAHRLARPVRRFLELELASALLLVAMTLFALVWANSPWSGSYFALWQEVHAGVSFAGFELRLTLEEWVNDALMAIFFFLVGMEIKRELVHGELSSRPRAMLPVVGALGGVLVPAGIYALFHAGEPTLRGWGIPMATDIAFAVAALSLLGARVPSGLRIFLLALAIADDIVAVSVIAVFYTAEIHLASLGLAAAGLVGCVLLERAGVRSIPVYAALGGFVWLEMHHSGVHATIAGVLLGFLTPTALPARDEGDEAFSPVELLIHRLEPWVGFGIMPLFALANAGVRLEAATLGDEQARQVALAVGLGLFIGKPVGITLFSALAVRTGLAALPRGVSWRALFGTGMLAGIGFTVALFVTALAFEDPVLVSGGKVGVLGSSLLATAAGIAVLSRVLPRAP